METVETKSKNRTLRKKFLSFFDDKSKGEVKWSNRNCFYAGTVCISLLLIILCAANLTVWRENIIENMLLKVAQSLKDYFMLS